MSSQLEPLSSIDRELADRLESDEKFRNRYLRRWAQNEVATEIRRLRKLRKKNQTQVAKLANTGQSAISRIEKADYDGWTFKTLLRLGEVLQARLLISFEPIEDVAAAFRSGTADGSDEYSILGGHNTAPAATTITGTPLIPRLLGSHETTHEFRERVTNG